MAAAGPSERELVQQRLVEHLLEHGRYWNAPYGIEPHLSPVPTGGKVRTVLFGVSRVLDATAYIWSPTRIEIKGEGGLAYAVDGVYRSLDEVIAHLSKLY